jgi:choline dehydrogenase
VVEEIVEQRAYDGMRGQRVSPTADDDLDDWLLRGVITGHHISSTCMMGPPRDAMAVVDQHAQVHGIQRLRVVDASILPDCPRVNINATVMMLAEKLADSLKT